ncbi:hypothetical protein NKH77_21370 [Streptomyces sp. M19]
MESWIHVEFDRETDREDLQRITADLLRVLSDVREAVEDWEKMREAALRIAEELPRSPGARTCRPRRSRRPASCCAGSPTTTSPSSGTASTASSRRPPRPGARRTC